METVASWSIAIAAVLSVIYLHALVKLHGILRTQQPALVERRGSLSFLYTGMPRIADPNVGAAVVRAAFDRSLRQSFSREALRYAARVRYSLSLGLLLYLAGFIILATGAP